MQQVHRGKFNTMEGNNGVLYSSILATKAAAAASNLAKRWQWQKRESDKCQQNREGKLAAESTVRSKYRIENQGRSFQGHWDDPSSSSLTRKTKIENPGINTIHGETARVKNVISNSDDCLNAFSSHCRPLQAENAQLLPSHAAEVENSSRTPWESKTLVWHVLGSEGELSRGKKAMTAEERQAYRKRREIGACDDCRRRKWKVGTSYFIWPS